MAREVGCYWVYGNKCFDVKKWDIYYWDGFGFWKGDEDFSEDCFDMVDDREVTLPDNYNN